METGQASLSITIRVSDSGPAVAPLYIVVRGTRFERRAAPNPLPPITTWTGTARLPVYVNVWDYDPYTQDQNGDGQYDIVTLPTRTALCTAGWRICVGDSFCLAAPLNMVQAPATYAICAVSASSAAFQSSGTASARLWIRVQPRGRHVLSRPYSTDYYGYYFWRYVGDPPVLTRDSNRIISVSPVDVVGTLVLPWLVSGAGRAARSGETVYSGCAMNTLGVGVVQQDATSYTTYGHILGLQAYDATASSIGCTGAFPPNPAYQSGLRISTYDPARYTAMSVHSMMPGHVRFTGHLYELEVWPDGQVSLLRRGQKTGTYNYENPIVSGVYALDDDPYDNVKQDTLLPRPASDPTPGFASSYNRTANTVIVDTFLEDTAVYGGNRAVALLDMRVGLSGQAVAPLLIGVGAERGYPRIWLVTEVGATGVATAPLQIEVGEQGVALAELALMVGALGAAMAAISVEVGTTAIATAPLSVWVHPMGVDASVWWDSQVTVGGVDVSARLLGEIEVEAEAGAARIARFRLAPTGAPLALSSLGADPVVIAYRPPGTPDWWTLFTGKMATPEFDVDTGVLSCTASDGRAAKLDAMSASEIANITPGTLYSPAVQGSDLVGAALADARMMTVAADLDLSPTGAWRVSPWVSEAEPHHNFARVVEGSLSVHLQQYTEVVNRVDVRFQYRYPVLADRACRVNWSIGDPVNNLWWVTRAMLTEAVEQDGWRVDGAIWSPSTGDGHLAAADLTVRRRYAQWVTEDYLLTVRAPLSETAHGPRLGGNSTASLSVDYDDAGWVDTHWRDPQLAAEGSLAAEPRYLVTDQIADGRGAADSAISAMLSIARVDMLRSLRGGRITATVACDPSIDLPDTIGIHVGRCVAQGRVIRVVHRLSGDDGRATTEFELSGFYTPGINPAPTVLSPPSPPLHPDPDLADGVIVLDSVVSTQEPDWDEPGLRLHYTVHTETESYRYFEQTLEHDVTYLTPIRTQFGIDLPPIPPADVDPLTLAVTAEYSIAVPIDPITLFA